MMAVRVAYPHALIADLEGALAAIGRDLGDGTDGPAVRSAADGLQQVRSGIEGLGCGGAELIVEEALAILAALRAGTLNARAEASEALQQTLRALPHYLRAWVGGEPGAQVALIGALNELRAVRGEVLASEMPLFQPRLDQARDGSEVAASAADPQAWRALVRKLSQIHQHALLAVLKGQDTDRHGIHLIKVFIRLQELCRGRPEQALWRVAAAFVEAVALRAIPLRGAARQLMWALDRELRQLAQQDPRAPVSALPPGLLQSLLFYVGTADQQLPRGKAVGDSYRLAEALSGCSAAGATTIAALRGEVQALATAVREAVALDAEGARATGLARARSGLRRVADALAFGGWQRLRGPVQELLDALTSPVARDALEAPLAAIDAALAPEPSVTAGGGTADGADIEAIRAGLAVLQRALVGADDIGVLAGTRLLGRDWGHQLERMGWAEAAELVGVCTDRLANLPHAASERSACALAALAAALDALQVALAAWSRGDETDGERHLRRVREALAQSTSGSTPGAGAQAIAPSTAASASVEPTTVGEDEEFRQIFVDEAREVLQQLAVEVPLWAADPGAAALLADIRRGFHTLKGSGRMVGATAVADLAWSVEDVLNKVLEERLAATAPVIALVQRTLTVLPDLVEAFAVRRSAAAQAMADRLAAVAAALAQGQPVAVPSAAEVAVDATGDATSSAAYSVSPEPVAGEPADWPTAPSLDGALLAVFGGEADAHLRAIRAEIARQRAEPGLPEAGLQRALHTLRGSAATANLVAITQLLAPVEQLVRVYGERQWRLDTGVIDLLEQSASLCDALLPGRDTGDRGAAVDDLIGRAGARLAAIAGQPEQPLAERAALNELLSTGLDHLLGADANLQRWRQGGLDRGDLPERLAALAGELRNLHRAALAAKVLPVAELGDLLGRACAHLAEAGSAPDPALDLVREAQRVLLSMIDTVAAGQGVSACETVTVELRSALEALAAPPVTHRQSGHTAPEAEPGDVVDLDILAIFLDEAGELLELVERAIHGWRDAGGGADVDALKRALHTLKGGARMAGLNAFADASHAFEDRVETGERSSQRDEPFYRDLLHRHDRLADAVRALRAGEHAPMPAEAAGLAGGPVAETFVDLDRPALLSGTSAPPRERVEAAVPLEAKESVKIAAPVLDNLVNLAGEVSISRGRVGRQIGEANFSLLEMESTITRLQDQIRRLGMETEAQILFRREQIESADDTGFDPLELDRYSQLQQLTRALQESASDLADIRETLVEKTRGVEALLIQQGSISSDLQETLMRTRMVPFSRLVPRLRRIVRQVGGELGKPVQLSVDRVDGEMDRAVLERMVAPLEHMIRNAIDHGIEAPAQRVAAGKPLEGVIHLAFSREGGETLIQLRDDGRGLDLPAIRDHAIARQLLHPDEWVADRELMELIFRPGFSTSRQLSQLSGRGVGMDIVNQQVRELGGSIAVASRAGAGTEFTLRVPFTLSANRALLVRQHDHSYALPLSTIHGVVRISGKELAAYYDDPGARLDYGGVAYRVMPLHHLLHLRGSATLPPERVSLILVDGGAHAWAVQVEALEGSLDIVAKSLGPQFTDVVGLGGVTTLGDGRVVAVLDLPGLLRSQEWELPPNPFAVATASDLGGEPDAVERVRTVLVVDDSVTVRKVTGRVLEREGFRVVTAKDGVDAMRVLQDLTPDLMLLDIEMPRMDGFEVARQVRSSLRLRSLPIVMITSRTGDKHRDKALASGVDVFLGKPYQEERLLATVHDLLRDGAAAAPIGVGG